MEVTLAKKQDHKNIFAALSAFQGELKPMAKSGHVEFATKSGGTLKFDYTPLGEIMSTIYPLLAKHGLSVRHEVTTAGVEAILTHETYSIIGVTSGEIEKDFQPGEIIVKKEPMAIKTLNEIRSGIVKVGQASEMKEVGAAITYARRYTLTMVLGISSEDDKDAALLEESAQNAVQTVYDRFKAGIEKSKTVAEVERSMGVLRKDLKTLEDGKAPALGMTKNHYEQLIRTGDARIDAINANQENDGK